LLEKSPSLFGHSKFHVFVLEIVEQTPSPRAPPVFIETQRSIHRCSAVHGIDLYDFDRRLL
jgi:hypothetical protein